MAGVAPPPEPDANGATIIFHCTADDTFLVGEEGNWLVEDNSPHYFAGDEDIVTTCLDPIGKTREQITIEAIPNIRKQIEDLIDGPKLKKNLPSTVKGKLRDFNEIIYPIVTRDIRNNCPKPVAGGPVLQHYFSYVTKRKNDPLKRSLGFPKGGRKKDRTTKQYTESVIECARRELYEEIGNIGAGGEGTLPAGAGISIDDADFVGYDGTRSEKYAVYYKHISLVQKQLIERVIDRRRNLLIGETFDLRFIPRSQLKTVKLNEKSKDAKRFIQATPAPAQAPVSRFGQGGIFGLSQKEEDRKKALNLQAKGLYIPPNLKQYLRKGGARKTRRRINRKRRTTSKRR